MASQLFGDLAPKLLGDVVPELSWSVVGRKVVAPRAAMVKAAGFSGCLHASRSRIFASDVATDDASTLGDALRQLKVVLDGASIHGEPSLLPDFDVAALDRGLGVLTE